MLSRRHTLLRLSAAAALGSPGLLMAQATRNLRVTVGFPAGDMADIISRAVGEGLRSRLPATVMVDNKPGAAGRPAIAGFARYRADGSELLFTPGAALVLFPHVFQKLPYDPMRDLKPVSKVASFYLGLAVGPAVPAEVKTLADYLAWVRKDPRHASYATSGAGTNIHLSAQYLAHLSNTPLSMVPYKGASLALNDLVAGQVPAQMATVPSLLELARAGRIRLLAVTSPNRLPVLPQVPTFAEQGYPQLVVDGWFGAFLPGGASTETTAQLAEAIGQALQDPATVAALDKLGLTPTPTRNPSEFVDLIAQEYRRWGEVARTTGFKPLE